MFVTTLDDLERLAKTENIEIFNRQIFKDDPSAAVANLKRQVICVGHVRCLARGTLGV